MRNFSVLAGLVNLLTFYGSIVWLAGDRTGSSAPPIVSAIAFNMAMAWLVLSGVHRNAAGERVWSSGPALLTVVLSLVVAGGAIMQGRG